MRKKIFGVLLVLCMLATFVPYVSAATIVDSGECGDNGSNATWTLYSDGSLVISGIGKISTNSMSGGPWRSSAVENNLTIKNVTIENGITSIGGFVLRLEDMEQINIPDSVTEIGNWSFRGCTSLTNIKLPEKLEYIGDYAFEECTALNKIKIPSSVATVGRGIFSNCISLEQVTLPNNMTTISDSMFHGCQSLSNIIIPDGVLNIGMGAFSGCNELQTLIIPDSVTSMTLHKEVF